MAHISEKRAFKGDPRKRLFVFPAGVHFTPDLTSDIAKIRGVRSTQECVDPEDPEHWAILVEIEKDAEWRSVGQATTLTIGKHRP